MITHEWDLQLGTDGIAGAIDSNSSMPLVKLLLSWHLKLVYALVHGLQLLCRALQFARGLLFSSKHPGNHQAVSGGSAPAPARHLAVVIAEHEAHQVSDRAAARVLQWCNTAGMELVLLYDPAGHLKQASGYIEHNAGCTEIDSPDAAATEATASICSRPIRLQVGWRYQSAQQRIDSARGTDSCHVDTSQEWLHQSVQPLGAHYSGGLQGAGSHVPQEQRPNQQVVSLDSASANQHGKQGSGCSKGKGDIDAGGERGKWKGGTGSCSEEGGGRAVCDCMQVLILSAEDAYSPVVELLGGTAAQDAGPIKTSERSHQEAGKEFAQRLQAAAGQEAAMEPQLIMVYSHGTLTLAGFPPWLARTAEILAMGPLSSATESGFHAALARFSSIKQRFGR